jgi:uncharacterized protein YrrD
MPHSLSSVTGASIAATDGVLGSVSDFFFDDQTWTVRYLVVAIRRWFNRRDVLIATSAVCKADWDKRRFSALLTREQVRNSPDVDTEKPVTRQQEIAMNQYFGWPTYWSGFPTGEYATGREYPTSGADDPHLRSVWDLAGYEVWAGDRDMGRVEDYILDETSWHIGSLLAVKAPWLTGEGRLVSTRSVVSVNWANRRIDAIATRAAG